MSRETRRPELAHATSAAPSTASTRTVAFYKVGEVWTVGDRGATFRLKDSKGLGYIAHLLRHPEIEFHVLDLVGGLAGRRADDEDETEQRPANLQPEGARATRLGDAGELLDDQAKVAYRRRLAELREDLEDARQADDANRAEAVEEEIEALTKELSRAVGLSGRNRRAASASERARQSVTKTIKAVLDRIAQSDESLAAILARCIRTGTFCSYQPDAGLGLNWQFARSIENGRERVEDRNSHGADDVSPAVVTVSPLSLAERTAFVGRQTEYRAITAAIDRASAGQGSIVMLAGGAGVGKTRLALEMMDYASRRGFVAYIGHCYERNEPVPFLPFAEIIETFAAHSSNLELLRERMGDNAAELAQIAPSLRRIFADIPAAENLPIPQRRRFLFQGLFETLARYARMQPRLFVLDDLHWSDESTLALLNYFANRIAQLPVVIIGTYRDGYTDSNPALGRTLEELIRLGSRPIRLNGLSKDAVAQMLQALSARDLPDNVTNQIFEESQGNPFFVEELWRHLVEDGRVFDEAGRFHADITVGEINVPETVRLVIDRRLTRFDDNERRALAAAAVIGRSFSFQLLNEVCQIDVDDLFTVVEKASKMGVIVSSAEGPETPFTFAHELVRQTLLAGISPPRREQLHASVASAIERLYPDAVSDRAGEIADHLLKGRSFADVRKLVRYLKLAASNALEAAAFEEARSNLQTALSYQSSLDTKETAELLANLATAELGLDRWEDALGHLRESLELNIGVGEQEIIGRSFSGLTDALIFAGRYAEANEVVRRGLAHFAGEVCPWRVRLLDGLSHCLAWAEGYEPARAALDEALSLAAQLADPALTAGVLGVGAVVDFHFYRLREAVEVFQAQLSSGLITSGWERLMQMRILYPALLFLGRFKDAERVAEELEPLTRKIGQSFPIALCGANRAWLEFGKEPNFENLENNLRQALDIDHVAKISYWAVEIEEQAALVCFYRGNWPRSVAHARNASHREVGSSSEGVGAGILFRILAYSGDRAGALALYEQRRSWMPRLDRRNPRGSWSMFGQVIEGLAMLGERSEAADLYALARQLLATGAMLFWPTFRLEQTVAGIAATAAHEFDAAENHFQIAIEQARSIPFLLEQAEICRFHAMMLLERGAQGDREKAHTLLNQALAGYTRIGMPRHLELTRALLG